MKNVTNKLRVCHFPQIPCSPFIVDVKDEQEAKKIIDVLTNQHLWLYDNNFIPDYANIVAIEMWDDTIDEETKEPYGWSNYYNDEEGMEWEEVESFLEAQELINKK